MGNDKHKYVLPIVMEFKGMVQPNIYIYKKSVNIYSLYTVGTESIQTPLNFSLFVILQPFAKII